MVWQLRAGSFEEWACLVAVQQEYRMLTSGCQACAAVAPQACHLQIARPASWAVAQQECHLLAPVLAIVARQLVVAPASLV